MAIGTVSSILSKYMQSYPPVKKITLILVCFFFISIVDAQEQTSCDSAYLQTATDIKTADPCLLTAAKYVLDRPLNGNPKLYYNHLGFLLSWMDKTPDFTFSLNNKIIALCKDDNLSLFNVYVACLAKAAIEAKKDFVPVALKLFVTYIEKPQNNVKQTSKIKKLVSDIHENKIEKYS